MGLWNTAYEALPRNKNNPGYGAQAIRELKSEISSRLDNEHYFGNDDETASPLVGTAGDHKEGSARTTVKDPYTGGNERGTAVTTIDVGRVAVDLTDRTGGELRTYDGDLQGAAPAGKFDETDTTVDSKKQIIEVQAYNENDPLTLVTKEIFNADRFVDIKFDQDIDGRKNYSLSPYTADPDTVVGGNPQTTDLFQDYLLNGLDASQKKQLAPLLMLMENLYKLADELLLSDEANGSLETFLNDRSPGYRDGDGYVNRTLKMDVVDAKTLRGTVWV